MAAEACTPVEPEPSLRALCSTICAEGLDEERIEPLFVEILRDQFSREHGRLERHGYRKPIWSTGNSQIFIAPFYDYNKKMAGENPRILVKSKDTGRNIQSIGDRVSVDVKTGEEVYSIEKTGVAAVYCISKVPGEAKLIAQEAHELFTQLGPILRKTLRFTDLKTMQFGELYIAKEEQQQLPHYVRPFSVNWSFRYSWTIRPEAPETQRITLNLRQSC